jgi:hypothetical protein
MKKLIHRSQLMTKLIALGAVSLAVLLPGKAKALITPEGPFTGNLTETWESFNNYQVGPLYLPTPTTIMGGGATISNPLMQVYDPSFGAIFGLGFNGVAQVSDGQKGMAVDAAAQTVTISFSTPVYDFGAYWGANAYSASAPATVTLLFGDGSSDSFTYQKPDTGVLDWHGWHSTVGISTISYTGDYVAIDGLQANTMPIPEPATWAILALALPALLKFRYVAITPRRH